MPATQTSEPSPRVLYAAARPPWVAGHGRDLEGAGAPDLSRMPFRYRCLSPVALITSVSSREPRLACLGNDHAGAETGATIPRPDGPGAYAIHLKKVGWDGRNPSRSIPFISLRYVGQKAGHFWGHFGLEWGGSVNSSAGPLFWGERARETDLGSCRNVPSAFGEDCPVKAKKMRGKAPPEHP